MKRCRRLQAGKIIKKLCFVKQEKVLSNTHSISITSLHDWTTRITGTSCNNRVQWASADVRRVKWFVVKNLIDNLATQIQRNNVFANGLKNVRDRRNVSLRCASPSVKLNVSCWDSTRWWQMYGFNDSLNKCQWAFKSKNHHVVRTNDWSRDKILVDFNVDNSSDLFTSAVNCQIVLTSYDLVVEVESILGYLKRRKLTSKFKLMLTKISLNLRNALRLKSI